MIVVWLSNLFKVQTGCCRGAAVLTFYLVSGYETCSLHSESYAIITWPLLLSRWHLGVSWHIHI